MNVLILGRWVMDASITGEDARLELLAITRYLNAAIVTTRLCLLRNIHLSVYFVCLAWNFDEVILILILGMLKNPYDRHEINRLEVTQVICSVCDTEQPVARVCTNCGVNMGEYFCEICKFYDDDTEKQQFHWDDCGICRVGGRENFFHCEKCGTHCDQSDFVVTVIRNLQFVQLGHAIQLVCMIIICAWRIPCGITVPYVMSCRICSKSIIDMSRTWKRIDEEDSLAEEAKAKFEEMEPDREARKKLCTSFLKGRLRIMIIICF
ncbi:hypothetical protein QYF36_012121 [Acer negundo]|nr:hypothetical protein QYF36_012121 [Acer negundo]